MNINEAAMQIKNAMTAYFSKDAYGNYIIPPEKQRPVFLCGAPGIGKTAIMEQIAEELGVGLVSYSMTHHTRQSAIGLPFITTKTYGGREYSVSEYTMSEIIASVYDFISRTGVKEGILFLDEINCVSETLMPSMLRFLQYKMFGAHSVPMGWIVVTAGNPPEYNSSVKEFDIATLDRLKKIDVEPVYEVWREYARKKGVHEAVIQYLDARPSDFYVIENTPSGKTYVTARGWEDLSQMLRLYEKLGIGADEKLVEQYLNNKRIAADFTDSYLIYKKYKALCSPEDIMDGRFTVETVSRAAETTAAERIAIADTLTCAVNHMLSSVIQKEKADEKAVGQIRCLLKDGSDIKTALQALVDEKKAELLARSSYRVISDKRKKEQTAILAVLERIRAELDRSDIKTVVAEIADEIKNELEEASRRLENAVRFVFEAFGDAEEMTIFTAGISENAGSAKFLRLSGSETFFAHTVDATNRQNRIDKMIKDLWQMN